MHIFLSGNNFGHQSNQHLVCKWIFYTAESCKPRAWNPFYTLISESTKSVHAVSHSFFLATAAISRTDGGVKATLAPWSINLSAYLSIYLSLSIYNYLYLCVYMYMQIQARLNPLALSPQRAMVASTGTSGGILSGGVEGSVGVRVLTATAMLAALLALLMPAAAIDPLSTLECHRRQYTYKVRRKGTQC